jgi:hypothetical protein
MIAVIRNGGFANGMSPDMPAWKYAFSDSDIKGLVDRIRRFCKSYAKRARPRHAIATAYRAH